MPSATEPLADERYESLNRPLVLSRPERITSPRFLVSFAANTIMTIAMIALVLGIMQLQQQLADTRRYAESIERQTRQAIRINAVKIDAIAEAVKAERPEEDQ